MDQILNQYLIKNMRRGYHLLPEHMQDGMERYITHGIMPGSFMTAVLENDLKGAFGRADPINSLKLADIVSFIYNYIPSDSQGSPESVSEWAQQKQKER